MNNSQIRATVEAVLAATRFTDVHTHLCSPALGSLGLWGIDDLITYHYLEAELFRFSDVAPASYWALGKQQRADLIWKTLFVDNSPLSEATRGVVAVLNAFGLPADAPTLDAARAFFRAQKLEDHVDRVFALAGVSEVVMTNDPLDPAEAPLWESGIAADPRFHAVIRLDRILVQWETNWPVLQRQGYKVNAAVDGPCASEVRRFLSDWAARMNPVYMAVSLADTFRLGANDPCEKLLRGAILPACRELGIPLALMIGVRRQVNPELRLAGDGAGRADLSALETLCREFPENRFLATILSRENQHELVVYARKFRNLMPFGCWWFLNNPSIVEEITRERLEMLGTSFIPQHSDARILEQLIYKWRNTRRTLAEVLTRSYELMAADGRTATRAQIECDVRQMFRTNFERFAGLRRAAVEA